jgi:hypothetical protein
MSLEHSCPKPAFSSVQSPLFHSVSLTFVLMLSSRPFLGFLNNCFRSKISIKLIMKVTNKMQLYRLIYYSQSALHVSGDVFAHHRGHLTVFTVSVNIHPNCCRLLSWMRLNSVSTHPRHQPAEIWVNTNRYCKYSQVFLMMDENIARNM